MKTWSERKTISQTQGSAAALLNVPNEAKRLLKTKDHAFASASKAKRSLKIKHLSPQSQEVIEK
jgi:hypothetical protein